MALEKDKTCASPMKISQEKAEFILESTFKAETQRSVEPFQPRQMSQKISNDPENSSKFQEAEILHNLGLEARKREDFTKAIELYTESLAIYPNNFKALFNRGFAYDKLRKFDLAIEDYTKSLEIEPTNAYALYNKGISLDKKGMYNEAINNFTMAITLRGDKADFFHNRGFAYRKKKDYRNAISDYTQAISINPQYFKV